MNSIINSRAPQSNYDWREAIKNLRVPMVSHEIGQWCVYPNFKEIPKYDGEVHILLTAGNPAMKPGDTFDTHLTNKTLHAIPTNHRALLRTTEGEDIVTAKLVEICTNPD